VLAAVLAGTVLASLAVGRWGDRIGRRRCYAALYGALTLTGIVFAYAGSLWPLLVVSLLGGLSTEVVESGPFTSLEQAMLAGELDRRRLARGFGVYNAVAAGSGSLGALAAAGIGLLRDHWTSAPGLSRFFLLLVLAALAGIVLAGRLTAAVERPALTDTAPARALGESRPVVLRLAGLFAMDSFGGGFVVQAFIAFWLAERSTPPSPSWASRSSPSASCRPPRSWPPGAWPTVSGCWPPWSSPTSHPTRCSSPLPSPRTSRPPSRYCWPGWCCHRWTSPPARPT